MVLGYSLRYVVNGTLKATGALKPHAHTTKPATPQDFHSFTLGMSTVSVALMLVQRVSGSASLLRLLSSR